MASYQDNDPKGWCGDPSRGAALGRATICDVDKATFAGKLTLHRVHIDAGGYDPNGTYFGTGWPIFWYSDDEGQVDGVLRATNIKAARDELAGEFPQASFVLTALVEAMSCEAFDEFTMAYVEAALWASTDDEGEPLDKQYDLTALAPETVEKMVRDCANFKDANRATWAGARLNDQDCTEDASAGHDFWLTRTGAGVSFRDSGRWEPDAGMSLYKAAKAFGEADLYVGDDGKIYHS